MMAQQGNMPNLGLLAVSEKFSDANVCNKSLLQHAQLTFEYSQNYM